MYQMAQLQEATIRAHCKTLRMPMIASQFGKIAHTSWRPVRNLIVSAERRRRRREPKQTNRGPTVEMTGRWKAWKTEIRFSTLSTRHWKSLRDSHIPTA